MSPNKLLRFASGIMRLLVGAAFALAASLKLRDSAAFAEQIGNYQLLPELSNYLAATLPSIELTAALLLVLGPKLWRHAAAFVLFGLLVVFTAALLRAWATGINLECGCFGEGSTAIGPWPVLRNLGLISALLLGLVLEQRATRLAQPSGAA